jgi:ADP-heptose:LPS heptosyltransferase
VNPATVRRLVIIRPRFLGDLCLTLPLLEAARAACPNARVAYVLERPLAPLLAGDRRVDEVVDVPPRPSPRETWELIRRLRAFAPDVVIDCFCNPRTALWTWASGAPVRVGGGGKGWRSALYTHHPRARSLSATDFHLANLAALGWPLPARPATPRLEVAPSMRQEAAAALARLGVPADAIAVGFHPGARWPTRRWAIERYVELAGCMLAAREDTVALFTAGPGEEPLARRCVEALPEGRAFAIEHWPIERFVGLQAGCAAYVCGDTGPLHTAVAAGVPTLALMSRNRPAMFFPYPEAEGHRSYWARVECSPCDRDECDDLRCLHRLTVEGAWRHLESMLPARVPMTV